MNYATLQFDREEVNAAGKVFVGRADGNMNDALAVIDNWRASHAYPAQTFFVTLKGRACAIHEQAITSQRTKRLVSIEKKLIDKPTMKLTQMQDIAGCRAVVANIQQLRDLEGVYMSRNGHWKHEFLNCRDYIADPRDTGYRGIHLKYRFFGTGVKSAYDELKVEIQIRTLLQHKWATAVEATDTFTKQALKANKGRKEWQRFFSLMGSTFAIREKCPLVPGTPTTLIDLADEIQNLNEEYKLASVFAGHRKVLQLIEGNRKNWKYYLVELDPLKHKVTVRGFTQAESRLANHEYTEMEKRHGANSAVQVVLVSASSISALKKAYPNYFLDTEDFYREMTKVLLIPV